MSYRLEAARAEGGRQVWRLLLPIFWVYLIGSIREGLILQEGTLYQRAKCCWHLISPIQRGIRPHGAPNQTHRMHMAEMANLEIYYILWYSFHAVIPSGYIHTASSCECANIYLWNPSVQSGVNWENCVCMGDRSSSTLPALICGRQ